MYDRTRRVRFEIATVEELIEALKPYTHAKVNFCGSPIGYMHVDPETGDIGLDHDDLEELYEDYLEMDEDDESD